jgi:hypothetical protein
VPTLAFRIAGYESVDTVPYLTPVTGRYWSSTDELLAQLAKLATEPFQPRKWVLAHMTDLVCANKLVQMTNKIHQLKYIGGSSSPPSAVAVRMPCTFADF